MPPDDSSLYQLSKYIICPTQNNRKQQAGTHNNIYIHIPIY